MSNSDLPILIIGAGMGGLGIALGLQRQGKKVAIYESAPQLAEVGAGLSLSPNATHALNYLGMGSFLARAASKPADAILAHFKTGEVLQRNAFDGNFIDQFGADYFQIHRADMHAGLVAEVLKNDPDCIHLGHRFSKFYQDEKSVTAHFANGEKATGCVMIGSDGIRSSVRISLVDEEPPVFTGQVAYRATLDARGLERFTEQADSIVTVGPGHIVVRYLIRDGELLNVVAIAKSEAWKEEGWNTPATTDDVLQEHQGWNSEIIDLIKTAPSDAFFKWGLFDRKPIDKWAFGRVVLLGDAAHPILPFLGMGAAMAFEDAVVLARCMEAQDDYTIAFQRYQQLRIARADHIYRVSRSHGEALQNSDPDKVNWDDAKVENDWTFFGYNPATVAI